MTTEAYPLTWPLARKRTPPHYRQQSRFLTTFGNARMELLSELRLLGCTHIVLSTNIPLRNDGLPYATFKKPDDPGVAVYFTRKGREMVFACDRWEKIDDNLMAIAKTINALRGIERWGSGDMLESAFNGFLQLEAPKGPHWSEVLKVDRRATLNDVRHAYRKERSATHGDVDAFAAVQRAYDMAIHEINKEKS